MSGWSNSQSLLGILVLAAMLRMGAAVAQGDSVEGLSGAFDEVTYSMLGHRLATGHGLTFPEDWYPWIKADAPQSYFSFAMSALLGGVYVAFGFHPLVARLLMAAVSTGVVALIYVLGRRLFEEEVALLASAVAAVHAYLVFYGTTLTTETPFAFAILASLYFADRLRQEPLARWWLALGIALTAAVHFRMAVILFVPLLLIWVVVSQTRQQWLMASIPILLISIGILPVTIWNYQIWGGPLILQSQFGHVFWNGNHPGHHGNFHPYRVFDIPPEVLALDNDALITRRLLEIGIENVRNDPAAFLRLTLTRLRELLVFWPTTTSSLPANILRVLSFGLLFPFVVVGLVSAANRWRDLAPLYLFIASHVGIHAVTWSMVRYRVPLDPIFILFASFAILRLRGWQLQWRGQTSPAGTRAALSYKHLNG